MNLHLMHPKSPCNPYWKAQRAKASADAREEYRRAHHNPNLDDQFDGVADDDSDVENLEPIDELNGDGVIDYDIDFGELLDNEPPLPDFTGLDFDGTGLSDVGLDVPAGAGDMEVDEDADVDDLPELLDVSDDGDEDAPMLAADDSPEYFPDAAETYDKSDHLFERIEKTDRFSARRKTRPQFPFADDREWVMAKWLAGLGASMSLIL